MSIRGLLIQWASARKIQLNVFVKNKAGLIIISLEISSFSPLYSWKIAELVSSNNHSLTEVHIIKFWRENNIIGYVYLVFLAEYNIGADPGRGAPGARPLINDWCDWLDDKYVILTLCSFNSSLHYNEYSYMSLLSRSGSCTNRHRHIFLQQQKPLIAVLHIEVAARPYVMSKISYFIVRTFDVMYHAAHGTILINFDSEKRSYIF